MTSVEFFERLEAAGLRFQEVLPTGKIRTLILKGAAGGQFSIAYPDDIAVADRADVLERFLRSNGLL